jgi:hypothetical protein
MKISVGTVFGISFLHNYGYRTDSVLQLPARIIDSTPNTLQLRCAGDNAAGRRSSPAAVTWSPGLRGGGGGGLLFPHLATMVVHPQAGAGWTVPGAGGHSAQGRGQAVNVETCGRYYLEQIIKIHLLIIFNFKSLPSIWRDKRKWGPERTRQRNQGK